MRELRSYIVRIYGQGVYALTGVVEDPRNGTSRPFRTVDEFVALVRDPDFRASTGLPSRGEAEPVDDKPK
ncbi:MAG TPA: hypothetical protein VHB46_16180 [Burkholderiales bacterium]|nr:hypothetical protein [Burkholderiales bacterium]